jgi:putative tricarboxylic transport membrane protein
MKLKLKTNLVSGVMFAIFAAIVWVLIPFQIQTTESTSVVVNAQFVPKMVAIIIFILSIMLLVQSLVFKKDKYVEINLDWELKVALFLLILIAYTVFMPIIGFLPASILFCCGALLYLKSKNWRYYLIAFAVIVTLFLVFTIVLKVPLP